MAICNAPIEAVSSQPQSFTGQGTTKRRFANYRDSMQDLIIPQSENKMKAALRKNFKVGLTKPAKLKVKYLR